VNVGEARLGVVICLFHHIERMGSGEDQIGG
jgi:hypothetical protein